MKLSICLTLVVGLVGADQTAPYLPSGWKPDGPAFLLPSEVEKPQENPLATHLEVDASASDFLREYGPPAIPSELTLQALPDVETEQTFNVNVQAKADVNDNVAIITVEPNNQNIETTEVTLKSEESNENKVEDNILKSQSNLINIEDNTLVKVDDNKVNAEKEVENYPNDVSEIKRVIEEKTNANESADVYKHTKNIQEALNNLKRRIVSQQVKSSEVSEERTYQEEAGVTAKTPTGFLEYGPPKSGKSLETEAFSQYGPPKENGGQGDDGSVSSAGLQQLISATRLRRFLPKFRALT